MIEGLVVRTMRHENDGFRFARDIMAILMTIIDEKSDAELANKNGFFVLSKVDDRIADTVRPEPIASQAVDIIGVSHPTVGNKDGLVRSTDAIELLPLCRCKERCQRAPELGIVRCRLHADGAIKTPKDLEGRVIATHQGPHAIHQYLLRRVYGVDDTKLRWAAYPQEKLLDVLQRGEADAVVLLDHFFFRGEVADGVRRLYTDGEAWKELHGFDEIIKHMVAAREDLLQKSPGIKETLLRAFRASFAYSETHLEEIADAFISRYGGDREALLASARYPKIDFTFTENEQRLAEAEMELLVEVGQIPRKAPLASLFSM